MRRFGAAPDVCITPMPAGISPIAGAALAVADGAALGATKAVGAAEATATADAEADADADADAEADADADADADAAGSDDSVADGGTNGATTLVVGDGTVVGVAVG
jgi:hypothetical protein